MRKKLSTLLGVSLFFTMTLGVYAQSQGPSRPSNGDARGSRGSSATGARSWSGNTTSRTTATTTSRSSGGTTAVRRSGGSVTSPVSSGGGYSEAQNLSSTVRRVYGTWPGYRYNPYDLYFTNLFYNSLFFRYGFLPRYDYLELYAQGFPALSEDIARMALRDCTQASRTILDLTYRLEWLIDGYKRGEVPEDELESRSKEILSGIRDLAKGIREDEYVAYLDQRKDSNAGSFSKAKNIQELEALVFTLKTTAREMGDTLDSYFSGDGIQVVSVDNLQRPSFRTMSKRLDKLAKTIGASVSRL